MRLGTAVVLVMAALLASASPVHAAPACFAAAARDPAAPCANPTLRLAARPGLARSLITPSYPCQGRETLGRGEDRADGALFICDFGVPEAEATKVVALIGDSHAMAWRAGIADAMKRLGWHGIDMTRSHCAFSSALRDLPEPEEVTGCVRFNIRVLRWLGEHPEVTGVIVGHQTAGTPYIPVGDRSAFATETLGFETAWRSLPPSVENVLAIRDNPSNRSAYDVAHCVGRARRVDAAPGPFCARPRAESLRADAYPPAVRGLADPRYALVDLSSFFCSSRKCFPVIGGALVTKDGRHLTRVFSTSLGPYLARAFRQAVTPYALP